MGTLTSLNISNNKLGQGAYKAQSAKPGNYSTKEANPANYEADMSGIIAVTSAISGMGALTMLIFGGDEYWNDMDEQVTPEPATLEVGMTKADFSNKHLGAAGAIIISAWISHKDNGALTSLDISSNSIGVLVPPHGWKGPDQHGQYTSPAGERLKNAPAGSKPEGAIAIADAIRDNGALECVDNTPYQSKTLFMMSTDVCRHCGQHKTQHTSRFVHISTSNMYSYTHDATDLKPFQQSTDESRRTQQRPRYERRTSAEARGRQQVRTDMLNCKVLVLMLSASTGSNSCSNPPASVSTHYHWVVHDVGRGSTGGGSAAFYSSCDIYVLRPTGRRG
jgi:hypothetical protein